MTYKIPKYEGTAAVILDSGLAGEWAVDRLMDTCPKATRVEAVEALRYAKKHGAGGKFERIRKMYLGRSTPF